MSRPVPRSLSALNDLFHWRCRQQPETLAYGFVRDSLDLSERLSYADLEAHVALLSSELARRSQPGDRVLLAFSPGLDVVRAFWAAILAGLIPVPAPFPDPLRSRQALPRLRALLADTGASLSMTSVQDESTILPVLQGQSLVSVDSIAFDRTTVSPLQVDDGAESLETLAYLQYTSGSTATPRGVMVTHRNILAQCEAICAAGAVDGNSR